MQPLPPLLELPVELKVQIFDHLSKHKYGEVWLAILRRTHPLLRSLIPHKTMPSVPPRASLRLSNFHEFYRKVDFRLDFLRLTESDHPYLFPPGFHPCFDCGEVVDCGRLDTASLDTASFTAVPNIVPSHRLRDEGSRCYDNPYFRCIRSRVTRIPV